MWRVPAMWEGATCFIFGGGLSTARIFGVPESLIEKVCNRERPVTDYIPYYKQLHDQRIIGVNNAYQLGDWIDMTFFGDCSWWIAHHKMLRSYGGVLVSCCHRFQHPETREWSRVKWVGKRGGKRIGLTDDKQKVAWNGNSGAAAINLAVHLGVKHIVLLGFDMKPNEIKDGASSRECNHWHGAHYEKHPHNPNGYKKRPPFDRHLRGFPEIKQSAKHFGVTIYNLNPDSALTCFPTISIEGALNLS